MKKAKEVVIITGSSGLIGYALAKRLDEDYEEIGFDRIGPPHPPPTAECVHVDLTSEESVQEAMGNVRARHGRRLAAVVHLAAYYDFSGKPSPKYESVTVGGTGRLLRALQSFQVEQFIFGSTMLVHAPSTPGQPITEDSPLRPKWAYPQSKVKTERLILAQRGTIPVVLLRLAGVYDEFCHSIPLAHQMQRIYERQLLSHLFPGDKTCGQSFIHLDDVVEMIVRLLERRAHFPPELVLLAGEPETLSYDELQNSFGWLLHGEDWTTYRVPKFLAKTGAWLQDRLPLGKAQFIKPWMIDIADDDYTLDMTRAHTLLDWLPARSLRDTLPAMAANLKKNPARWYRENDLEISRSITAQPRSARTPELHSETSHT